MGPSTAGTAFGGGNLVHDAERLLTSAPSAEPADARARTQGATGADWFWLGGVAIALIVFCGLPYLLSALFGPPELQRVTTFWFSRDFSQYQAAMREGAHQAGWLIHDHFSAEPHTPALMYPLYVGAGKLAAMLGLSDIAVFTALEWLGRFAILGGLYAFAATFARERRQVRLAVVLSLGTLGLDAILAPLRLILHGVGIGLFDSLLPDTINPYLEVSSFGTLLSAPHLMFGLALTLLAAPLYVRAIQGRGVWLALLGADVLALSLVHSFNTPVLVSVLAIHAVLVRRRAWLPAIVAGLAAVPMVAYSLLLYQTDPFWSGTYSAQNLMPSPVPWSLPADFGLVLLAAPLASPVVRRWPIERRWLLLLWVGLGLAWMYAPVAYQRRFAFGVQPGLAVLAAVGLVELHARLGAEHVSHLRRRLTIYAVLIAAISTSLLVYVSLLASAVLNKPAPVYLWSRPEAAAAAWLGEHSTADDVVLASTEYANPLIGVIDGRTVHGHIVATLRSSEKEALVHRFYAADVTPSERALILAESEATLVAFGPHERALGATDLGLQPGLERIYDRDGVQFFRVQR